LNLTTIFKMQIDDDPDGFFPVQDFEKSSRALQKLDWSSRLMAALIRSGHLPLP
jgi:hypothetical protein